MLPGNIDLTEHRDFSDNQLFFNLNDFSIDIPISDDENITPDQYDKIVMYENIFGKRIHKNQAREVFGKSYDVRVKVDWKKTCLRCGRPLFPWNNLGGICRECDGELNQSYGYGSIPWKTYNDSNNPRSVMDIFNLR